jgi:DNA-binding NarL/FixJ family response regulator
MRLLICDDQDIIREGLAMLLTLQPDITVVGLACDGVEALELARRHSPDLVLMDLKMPRMNGVEATRQLRARYPELPVLVLTTYDDDSWLFDALHAGAVGYILKDSPSEDLIRAVYGTLAGKSHLDPGVAGRVLKRIAPTLNPPARTPLATLSERETDVLRLLARGRGSSAVAAELHLSEGTVRNHISSILAKLKVEDRTQAVVLAIQHGLTG